MSAIQNSGITGIKIKAFSATLALVFFAGVLIIFGLTFWKASTNYHLGEKYLKAQNYRMAILAFEQSILNNFPWSPYRDQAVRHLFEIGDMANQRQDIPTALQAYHAVLFAKASLAVYRKVSPEDSRQAANHLKKINPLWVAPQNPDHIPSRFWSLCMGLMLLLWILSIFLFIRMGLSKDGTIIKPAAYYPLGSLVISFSLWLLAMMNL